MTRETEEEKRENIRPIKDPEMSNPTRKKIERRRKVPWSQEEDDLLESKVKSNGPKNWHEICKSFPGRSAGSCRLRWSYHFTQRTSPIKDPAMLKPQWTQEEDNLLQSLVQDHDAKNWRFISNSIPGRSEKSCWLRWCKYLSPDINHGAFSPEEDKTIIEAHARLGNDWATIARLLKGRTNIAIKNGYR